MFVDEESNNVDSINLLPPPKPNEFKYTSTLILYLISMYMIVFSMAFIENDIHDAKESHTWIITVPSLVFFIIMVFLSEFSLLIWLELCLGYLQCTRRYGNSDYGPFNGYFYVHPWSNFRGYLRCIWYVDNIISE